MIDIVIYFGKSLSKSDRSLIRKTLKDPRGWSKKGYRFRYTTNPKRADVKIYKISQKQMVQRHGNKFSGLSVAIRNKHKINKGKIYLNTYRWKYGGNDNFNGMLYKQYVINHEIGHLLGLDHTKPNISSSKYCSVMWQQTLGTKSYKCLPNPWI